MDQTWDPSTGQTISRPNMEQIIASYGLSVALRVDGMWGTGVTQLPGEPTTIHLQPKSLSEDADSMDFFHELSHVLLGHPPQRRGEKPEEHQACLETAAEELEAWALAKCLCIKWGFKFQSSVAEGFFASYESPFAILLKLVMVIPGELLRRYITTKEFRPDFTDALSKI